MAEDFEGVSWCASEGMGRVADVRLLREDETSVTYAFQPTRESVHGEQAQRFASRLRGEVTVLRASPDRPAHNSVLSIFTTLSPVRAVHARKRLLLCLA